MESMNGIQPMYDLADRNNNEWGSGNWIWIILLFFLFGGNWGNNGNLQNDALMNQEFIKRDLFNTNQNVSSQGYQNSRDILESRYTTQLGLQNLGQQNQECCCATQRAIDGVNAQSFKNTCDITSETVGVASLELEQNGEAVGGTESSYNVATANAYGNVSGVTLIQVPCGASYTITLGNNSGLDLSVQNANIIIKKLA